MIKTVSKPLAHLNFLSGDNCYDIGSNDDSDDNDLEDSLMASEVMLIVPAPRDPPPACQCGGILLSWKLAILSAMKSPAPNGIEYSGVIRRLLGVLDWSSANDRSSGQLFQDLFVSKPSLIGVIP